MSTSRTSAWWRPFSLAILCLSVMSTAWLLHAQPASGRIISDVSISAIADGSELHIAFTFPVRYLSHFPRDYGDTVQISLQPVAVSAVDQDFLPQRESFNLPETGSVPLLDVTYEGDLPGGPYLTLRFTEAVAFSVRQGSDFRSLTVNVFDNNSTFK